MLPLKSLGKSSPLPLLTPGGTWHSLACGSPTPISALSVRFLECVADGGVGRAEKDVGGDRAKSSSL